MLDVMMWIADELARRVEEHMQRRKGEWDGERGLMVMRIRKRKMRRVCLWVFVNRVCR